MGKPKIAKDGVPPEVATAFDTLEASHFGPATTHERDDTVRLTSAFGHYRVYRVTDNQTKATTFTIFFHNSRTRAVVVLDGALADRYVAVFGNRGVDTFPMAGPRTAVAGGLTAPLSLHALNQPSATGAVSEPAYATYVPADATKLIAYTEEHPTKIPGVDFKNWKGATVTHYRASREARPTGLPTQILLHETAGVNNMSIGGAEENPKQKGEYFVPHFCVNKVSGQSEHIIQLVDIAERTFHGPPLNDRSVGIELVNAPIRGNAGPGGTDQFGLTQRATGVYLKTGFGVPLNAVFLPLEIHGGKGFPLRIPEGALINKAALQALTVNGEKVVEVKDGVVTILNCAPEIYERLRALVRLIEPRLDTIDLSHIAHHRNIVRTDENWLFIYQKAWITKNDKKHYAVDTRIAGVYAHGMTGTDRFDGYSQALYVYLRIIERLSPMHAMQRMVDLLTADKRSQPVLNLPAQMVIANRNVESDPEGKPVEIPIKDYLILVP